MAVRFGSGPNPELSGHARGTRMGPHTSLLVTIIVVVTLALFLAGLVWRLYRGGGYDGDRE